MNISESTKKTLVKGAINGSILAAGSTLLFGNGNIDVMGVNLPSVVPLFVGGAAVSMLNEQIHDKLLQKPSIQTSYLVGDYASLAMSAGLAGALTVGVLGIGVGLPKENYLAAGALGAGSVLATDMIEARFLEVNHKLIF